MTHRYISVRRYDDQVVTLPTLSGAGDQPWAEDALCAQVDYGLFFPDTGAHGTVAMAKRICARCPVQTQCLDYALTHMERFGVWGGTSPKQRQQLRRSASESEREAA